MDELIIAKNNQGFANMLSESLRQEKEKTSLLVQLYKAVGKDNPHLSEFYTAQKGSIRYQNGYTLGLLKSYLDTLPDNFSEDIKVNGVPMNIMIKLAVSRAVLYRLEEEKGIGHLQRFSTSTEYWPCYLRLSEVICGFGQDMCFDYRRYEELFANGIYMFVSGFACGYSAGFHSIANDSLVETVKTIPLEQDIWKNWMYFLTHSCGSYTLDGKYLFMCQGGLCVPDDFPISARNNVKTVNDGVYQKLKARPLDDFSPCNFDLSGF